MRRIAREAILLTDCFDTYAALDGQGRQWKFMSDGSIDTERKEGNRRVWADSDYSTKMVSPICRYEDIIPIQEIIRELKRHGAITNKLRGRLYIDVMR